jgi:hypothetical protein
MAVADHQAAAVLITLVSERRDVRVHLGLQRLGQHPPGTLPADPQVSSIAPIDDQRLPARLGA